MAIKPTTSWDEAYPAGTTKINKGDDSQREIKSSVREVVGADHKFESSGQGNDWGFHYRMTCIEQADLGTGAVGLTLLGSETIGGKGELVYTDEDDNDIQITSLGKLYTGSLSDGALPAGVTVASVNIVDGTIVNADINDNAGIDATKIHDGSVDNTEFGYLDGLTDNIQDQLDDVKTADYDSGWFSVSATTNYTKAHSLSAIPDRVQIQYRINSGDSETGYLALIDLSLSVGSYGGTAASDNTNVYITTGNSVLPYAYRNTSTSTWVSSATYVTSAYYRILAWTT